MGRFSTRLARSSRRSAPRRGRRRLLAAPTVAIALEAMDVDAEDPHRDLDVGAVEVVCDPRDAARVVRITRIRRCWRRSGRAAAPGLDSSATIEPRAWAGLPQAALRAPRPLRLRKEMARVLPTVASIEIGSGSAPPDQPQVHVQRDAMHVAQDPPVAIDPIEPRVGLEGDATTNRHEAEERRPGRTRVALVRFPPAGPDTEPGSVEPAHLALGSSIRRSLCEIRIVAANLLDEALRVLVSVRLGVRRLHERADDPEQREEDSRKNIQPWPFRSILRPSQTKRTIQIRAPKPIPHHMPSLPSVVANASRRHLVMFPSPVRPQSTPASPRARAHRSVALFRHHRHT